MTLSKVRLERFTAFEDLDLEFSPGVNVLVGANGTGKTHLMKVCYAACEVSRTGEAFTGKLVQVFMPSRKSLGRMVKRGKGVPRAKVEVFRGSGSLAASIAASFTPRGTVDQRIADTGAERWAKSRIDSVFIPAKEMLANAPGFRSLYANREIHFEAVYADILDRAFLPALRDTPVVFKNSLRNLEKALGGRVSIENEEFFLSSRAGTFEFSLLAEGLRKLGLLWLLIRNGSLTNGSVLFWDEPEANLNPKLCRVLIKVLLELQRNGVQIFLATHDYAILEELDLQKGSGDKLAFYSMYRDDSGEIACDIAAGYMGLHPNVISEAFDDLYDRHIRRSLGRVGK